MTEPADAAVLPLAHETLTVSRREIETGVVRVATVTHTFEAPVNERLTHHHVEIERVPVGQIIEVMPPVRQDGDTTVIPVVEEIIVVEKRLFLKEEVHLRRVQVSEQHRQTVTLRQQEAVVTRMQAPAKTPTQENAGLTDKEDPES